MVKDRKDNFSSHQVHNDNELMSPNWQLNRRSFGFCMFPGFTLLDDIQEDFERLLPFMFRTHLTCFFGQPH